MLIVPGFYVSDDAMLAWLREYASAGGHLVLGIRSAYADQEARARKQVAPPRFTDLAGVSYDEYTTLRAPLSIEGVAGLTLSDEARATEWADGLIPEGAEILATYGHPEIGRFPAITSTTAGSGRVTYVGTLPNAALARDLAKWLVPHQTSSGWITTPAGRATTASGRTDSAHVHFVFNWSHDAVSLTLPRDVLDLESGKSFSADDVVELSARDVRVFAENV